MCILPMYYKTYRTTWHINIYCTLKLQNKGNSEVHVCIVNDVARIKKLFGEDSEFIGWNSEWFSEIPKSGSLTF